MFYLVLRKFVVGFWKRKQNREVKPLDDEINELHFQRDFSKISVKIGFNLSCFYQEMLIFGLLKFKI